MNDLPEYVLEREFDAPCERVWRAWTEPELFAKWYGPHIETVIHAFNPVPGGECLLEMRMPGGSGFQKISYIEMEKPVRLVCLISGTDAAWRPAVKSRTPDWPRTLLTTVTFTERAGTTSLRLTWVPHEASQAEIACFAGAISGLDRGWAAGMEVLRTMLAGMRVP